MKGPYPRVEDFLEVCRARIADNNDCVILVTGKTGEGKSTLGIKVLKALDETFSPDRVHLTLRGFLRGVDHVPRGRAVQLDESRADRRSAMKRETSVLNSYLRECRGRNLFFVICFPFFEQFDPAVTDERIFCRLHVQRKGEFHIMHRVEYQVRRSRGPARVVRDWRTVARFPFNKETGDFWDAYEAKKTESMENLGARLLEELDAPEEDDVSGGPGGGGVDEVGARAFARDLRSKYGDGARSAADVRA